MAATRATESRDDRTPIETPVPSPYRRCPLHDETVGDLRNDMKGVREDVKNLRDDIAEVKGHVLVLSSNIGKIDECIEKIDARAFHATKEATSASSRLTAILMAIGAMAAILVGGLVSGIALARAMTGG